MLVKHAISRILFFRREVKIHYLVKKKRNVGTYAFVVWWKVRCGLLTELTCSLERLNLISPFASEFLGFPFAELEFMNKRNQLSYSHFMREGLAYSQCIFYLLVSVNALF